MTNQFSDIRFPASWNEQEIAVFMSAASLMLNQRYSATAAIVRRDVINAFTDNKGDDVLMVDALVGFQKWFPVNAVIFEIESIQPDNVAVTVSAPAGAGTVSVQLSAKLYNADGALLTEGSRRATVTNLIAMGLAHLADVRSMYPPTQPPAQTEQPAQSQTNGKPSTTERHTATALVIKEEGGKRFYRVRAGWFSKYGAPVYPEVLKSHATAAQYLTMVPGEYPFNFNIDVAVTEENGKKQVKVTNIAM